MGLFYSWELVKLTPFKCSKPTKRKACS